jgi:hypothetical protein
MRALILILLAAGCSGRRRRAEEFDPDPRAARPPLSSRTGAPAGAAAAPIAAPGRSYPRGAIPPPSGEPERYGAASVGRAKGSPPAEKPSNLPAGKAAPPAVKADAGAPAVAAPAAAGRAPRGDEGPGEAVVFAVSGPEAAPETGRALDATREQVAAAPAMSGLDKDEISKMLNARLDVGAYRVQISDSKSFEKPLFDRSYDAMKDINLYEEFLASGVHADREAYWVRIAFIDLIQIETPFTEPRLYGLDKKRRDE